MAFLSNVLPRDGAILIIPIWFQVQALASQPELGTGLQDGLGGVVCSVDLCLQLSQSSIQPAYPTSRFSDSSQSCLDREFVWRAGWQPMAVIKSTIVEDEVGLVLKVCRDAEHCKYGECRVRCAYGGRGC